MTLEHSNTDGRRCGGGSSAGQILHDSFGCRSLTINGSWESSAARERRGIARSGPVRAGMPPALGPDENLPDGILSVADIFFPGAFNRRTPPKAFDALVSLDRGHVMNCSSLPTEPEGLSGRPHPEGSASDIPWRRVVAMGLAREP